MIDVARTKAPPPCAFEPADACALPFDADSFDVVAAMTTLEFVSDTSKALAEMVRCVQPAGRILIGTLNRDAPIHRDRLSQGKPPYTTGNFFTSEELRRLLAPLGYVRIATTDEPCRARPWGRILKHLLPKRGRNNGALILAEVRT